jgi:hypothetical protein
VHEDCPVHYPNTTGKEKELSCSQSGTLKCEQQTGGGEKEQGSDNVNDRDQPVSFLLDRLIHCDAQD